MYLKMEKYTIMDFACLSRKLYQKQISYWKDVMILVWWRYTNFIFPSFKLFVASRRWMQWSCNWVVLSNHKFTVFQGSKARLLFLYKIPASATAFLFDSPKLCICRNGYIMMSIFNWETVGFVWQGLVKMLN